MYAVFGRSVMTEFYLSRLSADEIDRFYRHIA